MDGWEWMTMSNKNLYAGIVIALVLGVIVGWVVYPSMPDEKSPESNIQEYVEPSIPQAELESIEGKISRLNNGVLIAIAGAIASVIFAYLSWVKISQIEKLLRSGK